MPSLQENRRTRQQPPHSRLVLCREAGRGEDEEGEEVKAYCDGACRCGNPGETSCAFAVFDYEGQITPRIKKRFYLGPELHTNNYAEYQGLLHLLNWAHDQGVNGLDIYCDSKLVVNQVSGSWAVNSPEIAHLFVRAYALYVRGKHILHHVHGHSGDPGNEYVDKLCNEVLDEEFARREKNEKSQ